MIVVLQITTRPSHLFRNRKFYFFVYLRLGVCAIHFESCVSLTATRAYLCLLYPFVLVIAFPRCRFVGQMLPALCLHRDSASAGHLLPGPHIVFISPLFRV